MKIIAPFIVALCFLDTTSAAALEIASPKVVPVIEAPIDIASSTPSKI